MFKTKPSPPSEDNLTVSEALSGDVSVPKNTEEKKIEEKQKNCQRGNRGIFLTNKAKQSAKTDLLNKKFSNNKKNIFAYNENMKKCDFERHKNQKYVQ